MRTIKRLCLPLLLIICSTTLLAAGNKSQTVDPTDYELLSKAIELVDAGMGESAMEDFDRLAKKYPDNFLVQYERIYALYSLHRYHDVVKAAKSLLKHKDADDLAFQLVGNAYDIIGDRKKAAEIYNKGLKRYPNSGKLYLELGNLCNLDKDYNKALEYYNKGIIAEPDFASNYFQASMLYFASEGGKVWGLVYAESEILLAPANFDRQEIMARRIANCLIEAISMNLDGEENSISVKLVPSRNITIDPDTKTSHISFPGVYEGALSQPLLKMLLQRTPFTGTLAQLIELRRGAVETYFSVTDNIFGNGMYLLEFQKKIIDAGYWDAYNYFLLGPAFPEEFGEWIENHEESMEAFVEWYNQDPYSLGDGRSVNPLQIYSSYRPVGLIDVIRIQAALTVDGKKLTEDSAADGEEDGE